jgi:uncharacterized protein (TIGR03435 family)
MMRTLLFAPLAIVLVNQCHCQEPANGPAFEVASITPCKPGTPEPPGERNGMVRFTFPGGRFEARATSVTFLLEWAYDILPSQHSGGPPWMDNDRYDIIAKAPGNATDDEMKWMTRALLAERYNLKFHHDTREAPVLILTAGKTAPKLFPPKEDEKHSLKIMPMTNDDKKVVSYRVVATRFSFAQLNQTFARQLGRVIVNQTGLEGDFDFTIELTPDENTPNPLDPSLVISAMRDQLELTLKTQRGSVDFLVIDSAERVTARN